MQNCSAMSAATASTTALPISASIATVDPTGGSIGRERRKARSPAPNPAMIAPTRLDARARVTARVARNGSMRRPLRTLDRTGQATASDAAAINRSSSGSRSDGVKVVRPITVSRWSSRNPPPAASRARTARSATEVRFIALPRRAGSRRAVRRRGRRPGRIRQDPPRRRGRAMARGRTDAPPPADEAAAGVRRRRSPLRTR